MHHRYIHDVPGARPLQSEWSYDTTDKVLSHSDGRLVRFTRSQGEVLEAILRCKGRTATYDYIIGFVWDDRHDVLDEEAEAKVLLHHVRDVLVQADVDFKIATKWGAGCYSTKIVQVISPNLKCCPRCLRPFTLEETDRGDNYGSHPATQADRHGKEARNFDRQKVAGIQEGRKRSAFAKSIA